MAQSYESEMVRQLGQLLRDGQLTSRYGQFLRERILTGDTWYTRADRDHGHEVAESQLREWERGRRYRDFAAAILTTATGMHDMAKMDAQGKHATLRVHKNDGHRFPHISDLAGDGQLFTVVNTCGPGCGCHQPEGSAIWGPHGTLGLKAVCLVVGPSRRRGETTVTLLLALQGRSSGRTSNADGHVFCLINREGYLDTRSYSASLLPGAYLQYQLGLAEREDLLRVNSCGGGDIDNGIGFPGATTYLADHLPLLGTYLSKLAAAVKGHES